MKPRTEDAKSQTVSPVKIHAPTPDLRNRQHLCGSVTDRFCSTKYLDLEKPRVLPRTLSKLKNRYNVSDEMNEKMRETQALKFLSSSRPHSITPFPVVEESSILTTVKRSTRNVTTSQLANFYTRKSITPIRQIPKLGVTRDVSYMLDLAKLQQKNPSDTLPSISIEELKDARARLDPSKDFSSILAGQDNNPKVHLFLKHNIFKKIPAEFYEQIQKPFFGDMLTSHKREAVDLLHKKQENDGGLGAPSSRNDSIILLRWFNSALEKLKDLDDAPRFELAQTVYYICFQEVIRQIAVHCVERGFIVWKLWNAYITLIEELALWYKRKVNKTVSRYDEQMQKIHERYEGEMEDMEQEVKNAIRETERAKKQVEEVEFKCEGYKIKIEKMKENAEEKDREHLYELQGYEDLKEKYERAKDKVREVREKMDELREEFDSYKMKLVANAKKGKSDSGVQVVKEDFPEIEIIEKKSDTMNMITVVEKIIDIYKEHSSGEAQTNDPDNNFAEPIEVNVVVPSEESPVQPLSTQLLEDLEWVAPSEEEHKNIPVIEQLEVEPTKPCKQQKELNTDKEVVAVNIALFITRSNKECQTGPIQRKIDSPAGAKLEIAKKPTIVAEDKEILQKPKGVTKVELRKQAPPGKEETMLREKVRNLVDEQLKLHEKLAKTSEDNKHIKEELSKEQKKLAEAAEKVKNLEVENFLLKDKLETVKDRLRQVEKTEQDLTQLVEKLESEKNAAEFRQIKEKMKEVKKEHNKVNVEVETDNSIEYHTPLKLLKPKNIQKVDTSFDFAREITKTSILQKDVDREYPTSNHLIRVDAARTKRNFLKKPDNRIVPLLIEKVLRENSKIYSMPKKLLLKTISHLYAELVSAKDPASDLANYVFNIIMNRFGLQSIAERKFLQILAGCIKHRNCKRVQMFGKFLLGDYSLEDFKLYLAMLKAVSAPVLGLKVRNMDCDEVHLAPQISALEFAKQYLETKPIDWSKFSQSVCAVQSKIKGWDIGGLVDVDNFGEVLISQAAEVSADIKDSLEDLFTAASFDSRGKLKQDEFELLMQMFEGHKYNKEFVKSIYKDQEELTLEEFEDVATRKGLFLLKTQKKTLEAPHSLAPDYDSTCRWLQVKSEDVVKLFRERLIKANIHYSKWEHRLVEFANRLKCTDQYSSKSLYITYRLLSQSTANFLKRTELERLFPFPLSSLCLNMQIFNK